MAATKEQIVRAYQALAAARDKAKKAADSKRSDVNKAKKALNDTIESPDSTKKEIVERHAEKKAIKAKASELVSKCNAASKEAEAKLDKMIKDADQWDLFPQETEEE